MRPLIHIECIALFLTILLLLLLLLPLSQTAYMFWKICHVEGFRPGLGLLNWMSALISMKQNCRTEQCSIKKICVKINENLFDFSISNCNDDPLLNSYT